MKALVALTLAVASAVVAVAAPAPVLQNVAMDGSSSGPMPVVQMSNGVAYLNGGASLDEMDFMKSRAGEFSLQILFSGRGGEYGVAEKVTIRNGDRELLWVPDAGPSLMLKLPPGTYSVEASFKGVVEKRSVSVGRGVSKLNWSTLRASD